MVTITTSSECSDDAKPPKALFTLAESLTQVLTDVLVRVAPSANLTAGPLKRTSVDTGWPKTTTLERWFGSRSEKRAWGRVLVRHRFENPRDGAGWELYGTIRDAQNGVEIDVSAASWWGSPTPLYIRNAGAHDCQAIVFEAAKRAFGGKL